MQGGEAGTHAGESKPLTSRSDHETATAVRGEQDLLNRRLVDRREFEAMRLLAGLDGSILRLVGAVLLPHNRRDLIGLRQVLRLVEIPDFDPGAARSGLPPIGVEARRIALSVGRGRCADRQSDAVGRAACRGGRNGVARRWAGRNGGATDRWFRRARTGCVWPRSLLRPAGRSGEATDRDGGDQSEHLSGTLRRQCRRCHGRVAPDSPRVSSWTGRPGPRAPPQYLTQLLRSRRLHEASS